MKLKKLAALVLAGTMVLSVAGCGSSDKSWAAKSGEETVSAGMYILNVMSGLSMATQQIEADADFETAEIEGVSTSDYVIDYAKEETSRQLALHSKFVELGLELTEAEVGEYKAYAKQMYDQSGDLYKSNGVTLEAVEDANRISIETFKVFQNLYGKDGEFGYTEDDAKAYFEENFYLAYVVALPKIDSTTGVALDEAGLAAVKTQADAYMKEIEEGRNIVDVIVAEGMKTLAEGTETPARGEDEDYQMIIGKTDLTNFPESLITHLSTAVVDEVVMVEDDIFHMIVKKADASAAKSELVISYYEQLLPSIKGEEYMTLVDTWGAALEVTYNEDAVAEYSPEKVKKITDDYIEKMMAAMNQTETTTPQLSVPSIDEAEAESEAEASSESTAE